MSKLTEQSFKDAAKIIGCSTAMVKAVYTVESKGAGFLKSGEVKILFEPHVFWKQLRAKGITPIVSDICYSVWGTKPYGPESKQHARLQKAVAIDRDAALMSASWGLFQIMGFNYKLCGCKTIQEFINLNMKGEEEQLKLFINYIKSTFLDDEMRAEDCKGLARGYNGPLYYKNNYDGKLRTALTKFK